MNYSIIKNIIGYVIRFEGLFMLFPLLIAIIYGEKAGIYFAICAVACIVVGTVLTLKKAKSNAFFAKEGYVAVSLSWMILSIIGCLPLYFSGVTTNIVDAVFEVVSGFTTTGATILTDVEVLPKCMNFWRCFTHWIGGMGVLVFILAVLPLTGSSEVYLMSAESPGPTFGKLMPKLQKSAFVLYAIYFVLTMAEVVLLVIGGLSVYDAICTGIGTAGTGGFGIYNSSAGAFTPFVQNVITVFMVLFGINFNFYFFLLIREFKSAFLMEEVRWYLLIYAVATVLITLNLYSVYGNVQYQLHHAAFQVASVMTTTGFSTIDFNAWPNFSRTIMVMVMFIGGCAGSTSGGIKVSRILIYFKNMIKELSVMVHPRSVKFIKMDQKPVSKDTLRITNIYLVSYVLIFAISILLISLNGFDMTTNFTSVTATFNNIGPGLELVGPTGNFSMFSNFSKIVFIFDMLAGRLEIFPLLILFSRETWRK